MKVAEKLKKYIDKEVSDGKLLPGDRLPSLRQLTDIVGGSYVTMHTAMAQLKEKKVVEVKKSGTFLSGQNKIKVRVNVIDTDISSKDMKKLLNKHLANSELYLDIDVNEVGKLDNIDSIEQMKKNYPVILSISVYGATGFDNFSADIIKHFPDYRKHLGSLNSQGMSNTNRAIPFASCSMGMGYNGKLMRQIGFDPEKMKSGFGWWEEYKECCIKNGISPLTIHRDKKYLFIFSVFQHMMLSLCGYSPNKIKGKQPLFNTPEGKSMLRILSDINISYDKMEGESDFWEERCPIKLGTGSWIAVQNHNPDYPHINIDELGIVPYTTSEGRKVCINSPRIVEVSFHRDLAAIEKKRIWKMIKIMTSRDFQIDYCNRTGFISAVKDVLPTEYYWNRDGRWNDFFFDENDLTVPCDAMFDTAVLASLSTILEFYIDGRIDLDEAAKLMDLKKEFPKFNG